MKDIHRNGSGRTPGVISVSRALALPDAFQVNCHREAHVVSESQLSFLLGRDAAACKG